MNDEPYVNDYALIVDALKMAQEALKRLDDEQVRDLKRLEAERDRYREALGHIVRGEEEAPVGMSNPAAIARAALELSVKGPGREPDGGRQSAPEGDQGDTPLPLPSRWRT